MSIKSGLFNHRHVWRNTAPLIAFALALCLLVVCCYESGHTSLPPTEKRYMAAKSAISSLRQDARRSMHRDAWEKLAREFRSIYDADPDWPNRPAALFRAAEALEELARRSCARADARKAISCYESLALKHGQSRLADDALFRAAKIRAATLRDDAGALALLARIRKQYPNGDMAEQAAALEKAIRASANGKTAPSAVKAAVRADTDSDEPPVLSGKDKNAGFAGDVPLRFKAARSRMAALRKDSTRSCWRQPWEDLREEFLRIRKRGKNSIAAESLFQAAECQKAIGLCSRLSEDLKKAARMYRDMAREFPAHALADDALLEAARADYQLAGGKSPQAAIAALDDLLARYPKGDKAPAARRLLSIWNAGGKGGERPRAAAKSRSVPELQVLSWDSINRNNVEITLELSAPAEYAARLEKPAAGKPARVIVDLANATVVSDIRKGVAVSGSMLKAVRVLEPRGGGSSLQFDFRDARILESRAEKNPPRIVLNVSSGKKLVAGKQAKRTDVPPPASVKAARLGDMASQLGLTVKRVFVDAGHGGKDPGTSHNNVVEKDITLDVALSLGKLLEANGMEVVYSRTRNRSVPLSERTRMANAANADIFVSIHVNANDNRSASGIETYYLDLATNKQAARVAMLENSASDKRLGDMHSMLAEVMLQAKSQESRHLAADIQRVAVARLKKRDYAVRSNGVKSAPFHVLLGARMPAVLVEIGYCSNHSEARNLATPKYRQAIAVGLAEGIVAYRDRLLRNRTADKALTPAKAGAI